MGKSNISQKDSLRQDLCGLDNLVSGCAGGLRYQLIAELWDFYVVKSPKAGSNDKRPAQQSLILSESGWDASSVLDAINGCLFDSGAMFVPDIAENFAAQANAAGFYATKRPRVSGRQAILSIRSHEQHHSGGRSSIKSKETKAACVLRHIRNSLAHGLIYKIPDGRILLRDQGDSDEGAASSAFILSDFDSLVALMCTLRANHTS